MVNEFPIKLKYIFFLHQTILVMEQSFTTKHRVGRLNFNLLKFLCLIIARFKDWFISSINVEWSDSYDVQLAYKIHYTWKDIILSWHWLNIKCCSLEFWDVQRSSTLLDGALLPNFSHFDALIAISNTNTHLPKLQPCTSLKISKLTRKCYTISTYLRDVCCIHTWFFAFSSLINVGTN